MPPNRRDHPDEQIELWDSWASAYDEEHRHLDPEAAVEFLFARASGGPALELAVGTGRIALPLAARGVEVTGIDFSPGMLERLEAKRGELPVRTVTADMATFVPEQRYPLVYCIYSGLFFLLDQDTQIRCLTRVASTLSEGGCFVLEAFNPAARGLLKNRQQLAIRSLDDDAARLSATMNDPVAQRVTFHELRLSASGIRILPVRARYAWPAELDLMARIAGFRLVSRTGGWDGSPFNVGSRNHVSVYELDG